MRVFDRITVALVLGLTMLSACQSYAQDAISLPAEPAEAIAEDSGSFAEKMIDKPIAILRALDKVTARTTTFQVPIKNSVQFGRIAIRVQACRKSDPFSQPEAAGFVQTWEEDEKGDPQWIFSGWMFASSPALSAMDHAVYDVWVLDCVDDKQATSSAASEPSISEAAEDGSSSR